ncbi:MAG: hypothetical protein KDH96_09730, partial [Candidatus Riesia sp.]|nr:hypothetical protein [Candidatus Riesia sp.]
MTSIDLLINGGPENILIVDNKSTKSKIDVTIVFKFVCLDGLLSQQYLKSSKGDINTNSQILINTINDKTHILLPDSSVSFSTMRNVYKHKIQGSNTRGIDIEDKILSIDLDKKNQQMLNTSIKFVLHPDDNNAELIIIYSAEKYICNVVINDIINYLLNFTDAALSRRFINIQNKIQNIGVSIDTDYHAGMIENLDSISKLKAAEYWRVIYQIIANIDPSTVTFNTVFDTIMQFTREQGKDDKNMQFGELQIIRNLVNSIYSKII